MAPQKRQKSQQLRVALLIESSLQSGRLILRGISEYARQATYWSIYYEPAHIQNKCPDWFNKWQGDGIIARVRNRRLTERLAEMKLPVVDVLGEVANTGFPIVQIDNQAIAQLAANHFLEHGFRSCAYCGIRGHSWSKQRREVFQQITAASNRDYYDYLLPSFHSATWGNENEQNKLDQWISELPKPIGIMAANDWAGQKVLGACRRLELMVPEEVAVIGVDNDHTICEISDPLLSSINAKHERMGFHAAELLDQLMQGKAPPKEPLIVGVPTIQIRQSTDIQTIDDKDVVAAVQFIRENACLGIQVKDVAEHLAISESTLKRRFRQFLSRTVKNEIMRVRIGRACELLTETEISLHQIAQATGFEYQEYFSAAFKSYHNMTPTQFRDATKHRLLSGGSE